MQSLFNGLVQGAVYALIALGYTMVYGILRMINFAHGEVYMIGAYLSVVTLSLLTALGFAAVSVPLCLLVSLAVAMVFCAAHGFTVERAAYKPLRQSHLLVPLISAVGMSTFLQNYVMLAQGKAPRDFPHEFRELLVSRTFEPFGVRVNLLELVILGGTLLMLVLLHLFVTRTNMGKAMRATSQDMKMASLAGINVDRVISVTFVIGSALAAAAGVMVCMYEKNTCFDRGYLAGLKAFTAAVLGGIGNLPGAVVGGLLLGIVESLGIWLLSPDYKDVYAFIVLILVLLVRPTGLLGEQVADKS
ncbi:MAG: branched-chain amino acid ABC transporter permease [Planctomycetota bacterium]|nr:branched-chain amino acid ABC transporter permease [Planctomycetota bacterium]